MLLTCNFTASRVRVFGSDRGPPEPRTGRTRANLPRTGPSIAPDGPSKGQHNKTLPIQNGLRWPLNEQRLLILTLGYRLLHLASPYFLEVPLTLCSNRCRARALRCVQEFRTRRPSNVRCSWDNVDNPCIPLTLEWSEAISRSSTAAQISDSTLHVWERYCMWMQLSR